ncbi:MAG: PorT family protein [Rikenellaceae bacterium]|nr:PorT family protein [Rikenellaceae bacterium]
MDFKIMRKVLAMAFIAAINIFGINSYGQIGKGFDLLFLVGVNIGATTPVPIPGDLKITGYHPRLNPKLGAEVSYYFNDHWGVGSGLTIDWKGMKVHTKVTDVHLGINVPNVGPLTGYVTGKNTTKVNTIYLTQPVYGTYRFNNKWRIKAGIYMAETVYRRFKGDVTDVKISIENPVVQDRELSYATLDYSKDTRKFDMGLLAGGEFRVNPHFGFFTDFTWGLTPYFFRSVPIHFTMRNIYLSVGATFRM